METKKELEELKEKYEKDTTLMEYQLESEKIEKDRLREELKRRLKEQETKNIAEVTELQAEVMELRVKMAELQRNAEAKQVRDSKSIYSPNDQYSLPVKNLSSQLTHHELT